MRIQISQKLSRNLSVFLGNEGMVFNGGILPFFFDFSKKKFYYWRWHVGMLFVLNTYLIYVKDQITKAL